MAKKKSKVFEEELSGIEEASTRFVENSTKLAETWAELEDYAKKISSSERKFLGSLKEELVIQRMDTVLSSKKLGNVEEQITLLSDVLSVERKLSAEGASILTQMKQQVPYHEEISSIEDRLLKLKVKEELFNKNNLGLKENLFNSLNNEEKAMRATAELALERYQQMSATKVLMDKQRETQEQMLNLFGLSRDRVVEIGQSIDKALKSPMLIMLGLLALSLAKWKEMQQAGDEFRKTTGLTVSQSKEIVVAAESAARELRPLGVGYEDAYKSAQALFEAAGNTTLATKDNVKAVAELSAKFGVAESDSAEFVKNMTLIGKGDVIGQMSKDLESMAKSSGVSVSQVMKDIAESAEGSYSFMSQNPKAFLKTAVEARKLGMSMKQISDITDGLLDIETSLNAEMEAQILSGKTLNLDAARYYALIGDQGKAMESVLGQVTSLEEFNKMAPLAQKAYASAVGMTTDEFAKMVMLRDKERSMTPKEKADRKALALIDDDIQGTMKKMENSWKLIVSDVSSIMLPVMQMLAPIFDGISSAVKGIHGFFAEHDIVAEWAKWITIGSLALLTISRVDWVGKAKGIGTFFGESISKFGRSKSNTLGNLAGKAAESVTGKPPTDIEKPMGSFSRFMRDVKPANMLAAGASMILVATAVYILAKAMQQFSTGVTWDGVAKGTVAMIGLTAAMYGISKIGGDVIAGAVALGIMGGALYLVGAALNFFTKISWEDMGKAAVALVGFSAAVFGLGALMFTGVGALLFGAGLLAITGLGVAMMSLGAGMAMIAIAADPVLNFIKGLSVVDYGALLQTAGALSAIGAGLTAMSFGTAAAGVVSALFGTGERGPATGAKDKTDIVIERLDKLIETIANKRSDVYLDGRKVGTQLADLNR